MQSARRNSAPPRRSTPAETIRPSRILPFGITVIVGLVALLLLLRFAFEKPAAKTARAGSAASQADPPPETVAHRVVPVEQVITVAHVEASQTTEHVLSEQGPDCLPCAQRN